MNVDGLKARGKRMGDLMIKIFKAYQVKSDDEFVRYIKSKRDEYDDEYNISIDKLTTSVLKKSEILQKHNKWKSMSPEKEQFIALASVAKKLKEENLKLSKSFKTSHPEKAKEKTK